MRCPKCGYVSFDHLDACKECGADLQEERQCRGVPVFTAAPLGSPSRPTWLQPLPSAAISQQEAKDRLQEIDMLLGRQSDSTNRAPTGFRLHSAMFTQPPPPSRGSAASASSVLTDESAPPNLDALPKAGFGIRLAAWIADLPFLFLTSILVALLVSATVLLGGWLGGEINEQVKNLIAYSAVAILILSGFVYQTLFIGACGQTPGKMLCGLKIVQTTGQQVTYGRAYLRSLCWILSLILFGVGFPMIAFTRQKQALHDILAGTYVIDIKQGEGKQALKFKNPSNNYVIETNHPGAWTLVFGGFYFLKHGIWSHFVISFIVAIMTFGISWLVYPFFASKIVRNHYLTKGWLAVLEQD